MSNRLRLLTVFSVLLLGATACGPAEPAPEVEEAPAPAPPPPPPTLYDLGEVDIVTEEPGFTSRNVTFVGVSLGDTTTDMLDVLGPQEGETQNAPEHYVSSYHGGGLVLHTFKNTGALQKIEILSRLADEVASPALSAWLEDGDVEAMRAFMGAEDDIDGVAATGATEYVYDSRGIRFIAYEDQRAIRFSVFRD
jgi:hypothetical protein